MAAELTAPAVRARKGGRPLVMVTAYDHPGARIADEAGVDLILVGDSLAEVVLGYESTLQVTVDDMAHHVGAVARARPSALLVADLPWLSYHVSAEETVHNAATLVRAGAQAVKLEGGRRRVPMVEALLGAEIPVMGHIGLTPQSVHAMGGYRVQGRQLDEAAALLDDARALAEAGCFAVVLEGIPQEVARRITAAVDVPTIGIGAGRHCDGQVLVLHDLLGLEDRRRAPLRAPLRVPQGRRRARRVGFCRRRPSRAVPLRRGELPPRTSPAGGGDHRQPLRVRALVMVAVLALAAGCGGGDGGGDEQASAQSCAGPSQAPVKGFGQVGFRVDGGDHHCALLAETSDQMSQGLMNQTDLGRYEGMVFRFPQDSLGGFYMLDTPMPLSIAWFVPTGPSSPRPTWSPASTTRDVPDVSAPQARTAVPWRSLRATWTSSG